MVPSRNQHGGFNGETPMVITLLVQKLHRSPGTRARVIALRSGFVRRSSTTFVIFASYLSSKTRYFGDLESTNGLSIRHFLRAQGRFDCRVGVVGQGVFEVGGAHRSTTCRTAFSCGYTRLGAFLRVDSEFEV